MIEEFIILMIGNGDYTMIYEFSNV
jgi:hypothetical protein